MDQSKYDFQKGITCFIQTPGGQIEDLYIKNEDDFEYDNGVYHIVNPHVNPETGERFLIYDKGNAIPKFHENTMDLECENGGDYPDASVKLMDEQYSSSMINKLSDVPASAKTDFLEKLKNIPPWMFLVLILLLVLLNKGMLGSLIPF